MGKKKGNLYGKVIEYTRTENGTSIGRRPKTSSMNKNKRRMRGKHNYRGQGKWIRDQAFIQMESLFHIKCHKILDHHQVEVVVGTADSILIETHFVDSIVQEESKILMFVINGENDTSKDKYFSKSL